MNTLKILRIIAVLEGLSFLILLGIAMPLKYMYGFLEATQHVGMAHGVLFLAYCALVIIAALEFKWSMKVTALSLIASVLPFGTFVADKKYFRNEHV